MALRTDRILIALTATFLAGILLVGCGGTDTGSEHGNQPISPPITGEMGTVNISVAWPAPEEGVAPQLIPELSNLIRVRIEDVESQDTLLEDTLERPEGPPWETEATYEVTASRNAQLTAIAYPTDGEEAVAQASGSMSVRIPPGEIAYPLDGDPGDAIVLTMGSEVTEVVVQASLENSDGDLIVVDTGDPIALTATALNADGETVLVPGFEWTSEDLSVAEVDDDGMVTGVAPGESMITATEIESGKAGSVMMKFVLSTRLYGLCYGPFRTGQSPDAGVFPSEAEVAEDMALLAGRVERIRLYSSTNIHRQIPRLAAEEGLACWAQAWIGEDLGANETEIEALIEIGQSQEAEVLIVGSEVLERNEMSAADLITLIERVRAEVPGIPVTYNDTDHQLIENPDVVAACDFVLVNIYPFWNEVPIEHALEHVAAQYERLSAAFPNQRIVIGETGWPSGPSDGTAHGAAVPDPVNQRDYFAGITEWAESNGVELFYFSAFDEEWKVQHEGPVGAHWGLFNADRTIKSEIRTIWE